MNNIFKWYFACHLRRGLDDNGREKFTRLKSGLVGELALRRVVESISPEICFMTNKKFRFRDNDFETDAILICDSTVYILEAKNYQRPHHYFNGEWRVDGLSVTYNPFYQINRAVGFMKQLLKHSKVEGVLVDVNPEESLFIDDTSPYLTFSLKSIVPWLESLPQNKLQDESLLQTIDAYSNSHINMLYFYDLEADFSLNPGCYCKNCGSFDLKMNLRNFVCKCGFEELKTNMLTRMLDEYALLFNKEDIKIDEFKEFTNYVFSQKMIAKEMAKYERIGRQRYINPYGKFLRSNPKIKKRSKRNG